MQSYGWIVMMIITLTIYCCIPVAFAGAPPQDERVAWLIPLAALEMNKSISKVCISSECYFQTDVYDTGMLRIHPDLSFRQPFYFPNISRWYGYKNFSSESGTNYTAEVWYYDNWDEFSNGRIHLFQYLTRSGKISNITITFQYNETLATYNGTHIEEQKSRQIDAIQYVSNSTSGYFIIFDSHFFPGPNYFIAYYGVVGSSELEKYSTNLKSIMSLVPEFMDDGVPNDINPESPMPTPTISVPVILPLGAMAIMVLLRKIRRNQ